MADAGFPNLVPGFEFLQGLVSNASAALPNMGQWVAPTLNPDELEKRIEELRTVQFWLEQNARMLGATIQALEVQRMTLTTLKTMNVQMADLRESLKIKLPEQGPPGPARGEAAPAAAPAAASSAARKQARKAEGGKGGSAASPGIVDPMQWWTALTSQFAALAANTMKEGAAEAAKGMAAVGDRAAPAGTDKAPKKGKAAGGATPDDRKDKAPAKARTPRKRPAPT